MTRQEVNRIINEYIIFKPFIWNEVDQFVKDFFEGNFVIGVHYRGTDKKSEAPRVPYEVVAQCVLEQMGTLKNSNVIIYVATDEVKF